MGASAVVRRRPTAAVLMPNGLTLTAGQDQLAQMPTRMHSPVQGVAREHQPTQVAVRGIQPARVAAREYQPAQVAVREHRPDQVAAPEHQEVQVEAGQGVLHRSHPPRRSPHPRHHHNHLRKWLLGP